jgi:hypothetical protein
VAGGTVLWPGRWVGPWIELIEHPLGLHDPSLRFVLATEPADRAKPAFRRL